MKILVAVSGGVDSVALLDLLARKRLAVFLKEKNLKSEIPNLKLSVAHFNHAIHPQADTHEKFVAQLAQKYSLEFFSEKAKRKLRGEAAAREARYLFLQKLAQKQKCELIALAHHAGDQAETVLLNLIRGSGIGGLGGMREISAFAGVKIWRPLLNVPKSELGKYARAHRLKFVRDPTNRETKYARNFLRREIIPKIEKLNPRCEEAFLRLARAARESSDFVSLLACEWLRRFARKKTLDLAAFDSLPPALAKEVIREIHRAEAGDLRGIEEKHAEEVLALARNPRGGKRKKFGKIIFQTGKTEKMRVLKWK